ncbi:MAG: cbb3-type cytochrome oxidase assembly protein CcoS, partial [Bryobacteraceae bacterium]|nr:cbb3-type cytochrome oxidase assembly protein CcoS [Bryobacteraceae bacterium]
FRVTHASGLHQHERGEPVTAFYVALWGLAAALGATAIGGLVWAIRRGEFDNLREGAASIFDDEEPIGQATDRFPGE